MFLQEEEIPELEIDIDELLELSDEGQRTRLHVSLCTKTITFYTNLSLFRHLFQLAVFAYFMELVPKTAALQTKGNLSPRSATFRPKCFERFNTLFLLDLRTYLTICYVG